MRKLARAIFASAVLASYSVAAEAEDDRVYATNSDWSVYENVVTNSCYALRAYTTDKYGLVMFRVSYLPAEKAVFLHFSSELTTSLPDVGTVEANIVFTDNGDELWDDLWPERTFDVEKEDTVYLFTTPFVGTTQVDQILNDVSASSAVLLQRNEKTFSGILLDGSAQAIKNLKSCSLSLAGINPDDPFAF